MNWYMCGSRDCLYSVTEGYGTVTGCDVGMVPIRMIVLLHRPDVVCIAQAGR